MHQCWKDLDRPAQVQLDNARELAGWGPAARTLSRVIRLCLRFGVEPVFIPPGMPEHNGSVENFNGWFQPRLFQRLFQRPTDLRQELARLQEAVNTQHVHPRLVDEDLVPLHTGNQYGVMGFCNHEIYTRSYRFGSESKSFPQQRSFGVKINPIYLAELSREER